MSQEGGHVLLASEAEVYIEHLQPITLPEIGSPRWAQQHEYIEKLNMQAVLNASANEDEFVKEYLISHEKIPVLVHELIATEVWTENIFPKFIELDLEPKVTFPMYMVLYHEATVANLLETVLFHEAACEAAEDSILDLLDYCYRKITHLISREESEKDLTKGSDLSVISQRTTLEELEEQQQKLNFEISIKAVSILRYMTDHINKLPLSAVNRLLNTLDVPILLVELVENPPWTSMVKGKLMKYIDNKWQKLSEEDRFKLTKIEGQVWIALFHVLMDQDCQRKYEYNDYRKNVLLKLRSYVTELLLDQMPVLVELQRFLQQLSIMEPPPASRDLVLEQIPEVHELILKEYDGQWTRITKKQFKEYFNTSKASIQSQAQRLSEMYNFDVMESLITEPPKCAVCGNPAGKRCSRCQNEWYCRRQCQVSHWGKHKKACDLLTNSLAELKKQEISTTAIS